jgi:hypothetical protein
VSKDWKPSKKTVELQEQQRPRPSRIRREPVPIEPRTERGDLVASAWWRSDEWEIPIAIVGMIVFALGINAMWFVISQLLGI